MKTEQDWSASHTVSWGGVNQCPKWREQALLLMWHICQLIAAAMENEGFPFIFRSADRTPSFNLSSLPLVRFYFISFFYLWDWSMFPLFLLILFPSPVSSLSSFTEPNSPLARRHLQMCVFLLFSEAGWWRWSLVFCPGRLACLCGCVAPAACTPVCVLVQRCVSRVLRHAQTDGLPEGFLPIIPLT